MDANLGPQFHGTAADLHPGDRVLPARETGAKSAWPGYRNINRVSSSRLAHSTSEEKTAWRFAGHATQHSGGRAAVLVVKPHPDQQMGRFNPDRPRMRSGPVAGEMVAPHFDVAERLDIKPGHQGTFPTINWNQFSEFGGAGSHSVLGSDEINHPPDERISGGHQPHFQGMSIFRNEKSEAKAVKDKIEAPEQGRLF